METVYAMSLERRLLAALDENQFRLHYQPQVERRTGRIVGAEALLRWQDPDAGLLAPGHFLPVLESTGLIVPVGEWVLRQVTEDCQRWQRLGFPRLRMAVNLSMTQLHRRDAEHAFDTSAVRACSDLQFEMPAREIAHASQDAIRVLHSLRYAGVDIVAQDFDADDEVCTRLWALPVDALKIDRTLIRLMAADMEVEVAVSSIVILARAFGLGLVAEGVERLDQIELLAGMGCEHAQGFAYSPAVSAAQFEKLLAGPLRMPLPSAQQLIN